LTEHLDQELLHCCINFDSRIFKNIHHYTGHKITFLRILSRFLASILQKIEALVVDTKLSRLTLLATYSVIALSGSDIEIVAKHVGSPTHFILKSLSLWSMRLLCLFGHSIPTPSLWPQLISGSSLSLSSVEEQLMECVFILEFTFDQQFNEEVVITFSRKTRVRKDIKEKLKERETENRLKALSCSVEWNRKKQRTSKLQT
jgi:hypothetical protein